MIHQPEILRLSNGIPVIFQHLDGPVGATYWWVSTGSTDERPEEAGFAHFLEHMLFKDSAAKDSGKASTGKTAQAIESLGGDINAYTSFDQTVYHVTSAETHWLNVIDEFGVIAKPQRFLKSDFESEREVILEELAKNEDSPGRQLFCDLFAQTFKSHPYGKPVIGYAKTLKAAKVGGLESFYNRSYVTGRMGLVVVGPIHDAKGVRKKEIFKRLEKHFGSKVRPKKDVPRLSRPNEADFRAQMALKARAFDVQSPSFCYSFRVPSLEHPDTPAIDLLAGVLGMGELGRLYQKLFYEKSIVLDVSGSAYIPKDRGMLYFQAETPTLAQVSTATEALFQELERIKTEGPTQAEVERIIVNTESEKIYATQSADGLAGRLGFLQFVVGDLSFDERYLEKVRSLDTDQIAEAARKYLDPRRLSGSFLLPKKDQLNLDQIREIAAKNLSGDTLADAKPVKVSKGKPQSPVHEQRLEDGTRVVFYPRKGSRVFSIHASCFGGVRAEARAQAGVSHLMGITWNKGSEGHTSKEIAALVEGKAASLDGFSGRNSIGLQMTGLARDWDSLSNLLGEVLVKPRFPDTEVGHSKRIQIDSIKSLEDHSSQVCSKLFLETLFEHHPYGHLTVGTLESVEALKSKDLLERHAAWVRPEQLVLSVSGDVREGALQRWVDGFSKRWGAQKGHAEKVPHHLADEPALKAPRWVEKNLGREQVHIIIGSLGLRLDSKERRVLQILSNVLGGQSGRLFLELREKKSLAYSVSPISFEGMERGYVGTYIACSPGKKKEATDGIRSVLEKLVEKGPTPKEMERAKEYHLGRRAMDLQGESSFAAYFGLETLYSIPIRHHSEIEKEIRAITAKEVRALCERLLVKQFQVTAMVG